MKMMKIEPVAKPKSFKDLGFTERDWAAAKKLGVVDCPALTAIANVRRSKGLYQLVRDVPEIEAKHQVNGLSLGEMDVTQLKILAFQTGITLKKGMTRRDVITAIQTQLDKVKLLEEEDDAVEPDGTAGAGKPTSQKQ